MTAGRIIKDGEPHAVDWAVAQRSKYEACGDGYAILQEDDLIYAVLIDGIGSGVPAQTAAEEGLRALNMSPVGALHSMFDIVHNALQSKTRGAAMAAVEINLSTCALSWASVGDVDAMLDQADGGRCSVIQVPGTLGMMYSGIKSTHHDLHAGDILTLVSDGIQSDYRRHGRGGSPSFRARHLVGNFARQSDDSTALCLQLVAA